MILQIEQVPRSRIYRCSNSCNPRMEGKSWHITGHTEDGEYFRVVMSSSPLSRYFIRVSDYSGGDRTKPWPLYSDQSELTRGASARRLQDNLLSLYQEVGLSPFGGSILPGRIIAALVVHRYLTRNHDGSYQMADRAVRLLQRKGCL